MLNIEGLLLGRINHLVLGLLYLFLSLLGIGCQPNLASSPIADSLSTSTAVHIPSPSSLPLIKTPLPPVVATDDVIIEATIVVVSPSSTKVAQDFDNLLLYEGNREVSEIYILKPGEASQLLGEGQIIGGQAVSPDGTKLVFDNDGSSQSYALRPDQLSLIDLNTGEESLLELARRPFEIFWSPDNGSFVYTVGGENNSIQIVEYDIKKKENRVLIEIPRERKTFFSLAGFSPQGDMIAFISEMNKQFDVYILDITSNVLRQVTDTPDIEVMALWSPVVNDLLVGTTNLDESLAFNQWPYQVNTLYLIDSLEVSTFLLGDSFRITTATWAPDGNKIAYSNNGTLCILETNQLTEVCPLPETTLVAAAFGEPPSWSSDGHWLAFRASGDAEACNQLYIFDLLTNDLMEADLKTCTNTPVYWTSGVARFSGR